MVPIVLLKIAALFFVILAGWLARRRGFLAAETTALLSRLVVDLALPALVFTQLLHTVDLPALRESWFSPLMCVVVVLVAYLVGLTAAKLFCDRTRQNTFVFLVSIPNWVYLPLPIAEALYGDAGVRVVLLSNVAAQALLWTFGVWLLHGSVRQAARNLLTNAGLWATAAGVAVGLAFPSARDLATLDPATASPGGLIAGAVVQALVLVGGLTVPLSLLAIGAQLGGLVVPVHRFPRAVWGVLLARLVAAPLATLLLGSLAIKAGLRLPESTRMVGYLIAAMPSAISCSVLAERFKGDVELAAPAVFYTTLFSLVTVPAFFFRIQHFGL